jgi:hypothetical protein
VEYERDRRVSSPAIPVPSRVRATAPGIVIPPAGHSNEGSRPKTAITSSRTDTPTDTLLVRPPSVSPCSAAFAQPVPPPQGATTPRRPVSPNPLPRGVSPAPLPRASSPAPLPIRSPSLRSTHIHRSPSDVSLPGAPSSPYKPYNPNLDADIIAVLASLSVDAHAPRTASGHDELISEPRTPKQRPAALHPTKTPPQRGNVSNKSPLPSVNHSGLALPVRADTSMQSEVSEPNRTVPLRNDTSRSPI